MSTTAARIPAFRQCILPAGWDMARPPAVPGRALARPPRAPAGPVPRRPLPAPAPAPRPPAASLAWAPPRLGAPRGSGDWALTSRRPSASPRSPPGGQRPLPQHRHLPSSLRARPGRAAPGLGLRRAAGAGTPPRPRLLRPGPGRPRLRALRAARDPRSRALGARLPPRRGPARAPSAGQGGRRALPARSAGILPQCCHCL